VAFIFSWKYWARTLALLSHLAIHPTREGFKRLKPSIAIYGNQSQSFGASINVSYLILSLVCCITLGPDNTVITESSRWIFGNWMFRRRQVVSNKRLRRSVASASVQRSRRLSGHSFLARGARSATWSEQDNHLLPGEGRPRSSAAAAQVTAGPHTCQGQTQGKPKTGSILRYFNPLPHGDANRHTIFKGKN